MVRAVRMRVWKSDVAFRPFTEGGRCTYTENKCCASISSAPSGDTQTCCTTCGHSSVGLVCENVGAVVKHAHGCETCVWLW